MKRKKIWKLFRLPSPSDLGMTDDTKYDSLPMKIFQNAGDTSPTWEDWDERVKKDYPIRYFFAEGMWPWLRLRYRLWVTDPIYWLKCHLLSKHRYHMLDLRQPKTELDPMPYRFGWLDSDGQMVYALFNILNRFVEHEMPHWYCPSEEEVVQDATLLTQRHAYMEVKAIHYWWNVARPREEKAHAELLHAWHEAKENKTPEEQQLWADLRKGDTDEKEKLDDMLIRLIKIRIFLWT